MDQPVVLNSWKEIASYLGRGRRTVQRWERELHLPVHRPKGRSRSAVLALPQELDRWLAQAPILTAAAGANGETNRQRREQLAASAHELLRRAEEVRLNAARLHDETAAVMQRFARVARPPRTTS